MKHLLLLFCILLSLSTKLSAQTTYQEVIATFFEKYEKEDPASAVDYIFSTNKYLTGNDEQVAAIKMKLNTAVAVIGPYTGYEAVIIKEIGTCMVVNTYIVKYERQPLFFTFVLYKPGELWQVQTLRFDDKLDEETMKMWKNSTK